ncbi:MAG: OadG family protein [Clostridia bacterium]|nr:OadG family protein [Clostridia bacterium]
MNIMLLAGEPQITPESSIFDRLTLGGSTLLIGMLIVFSVLGIIFIALQIMRAVFTKQAIQAKKARKAEAAAQKSAVQAEEAAPAPVVEAPADDSEIVAAIVAAISAYTGKAPEGFRVVSFKKRR